MKTVVRLLALFAFSFACHAQEAYPNKPIRLIVPYPPGGVAMPSRAWSHPAGARPSSNRS